MKQEIDFVISWVDGSDPAWIEERNKISGEAAQEKTEGDELFGKGSGDERYRDWETLQYWFRGVEQYTPWVRNIYFVTWGHVPKWLNVNHPKLRIINHRDFIPEEYLPTFNSNVIELNFHRIPGLSENFVYFNDDMVILRPVEEEYFFKKNHPVDMLAFQPVVANESDDYMPYIYLNNSMTLARHFTKRECVKAHRGQYFHPGYPLLYFGYNLLELAFPRYTGFYTQHGPSPLKKSTYETLWEKEGEVLHETCMHPFRDRRDVNQYLLREWQKLSGDFVPENIEKGFFYHNLSDDNRRLFQAMNNPKKKIFCINDSASVSEYDRVKGELVGILKKILPRKSTFEK